jgi:hypothetical protein
VTGSGLCGGDERVVIRLAQEGGYERVLLAWERGRVDDPGVEAVEPREYRVWLTASTRGLDWKLLFTTLVRVTKVVA